MKNRRALYRMGITLLCLALYLSFSGLAQAIPVTFSFQGSVQGASSQLNPPIVPNTVISGSYTFESTAPDLLPGNLAVGTYALSAFSVSLLGNAYSMGPVGERIITITNSPTTDTYRVSLARVELDQPQAIIGPSINGWAPRAFSLSITENGLFNNDSLPLVPPSLGPSPIFTMTFFSGADAVQAAGRLTSLTAVPEPSSIVLMGLGLLGLIGFEMRRRWAARTQ